MSISPFILDIVAQPRTQRLPTRIAPIAIPAMLALAAQILSTCAFGSLPIILSLIALAEILIALCRRYPKLPPTQATIFFSIAAITAIISNNISHHNAWSEYAGNVGEITIITIFYFSRMDYQFAPSAWQKTRLGPIPLVHQASRIFASAVAEEEIWAAAVEQVAAVVGTTAVIWKPGSGSRSPTVYVASAGETSRQFLEILHSQPEETIASSADWQERPIYAHTPGLGMVAWKSSKKKGIDKDIIANVIVDLASGAAARISGSEHVSATLDQKSRPDLQQGMHSNVSNGILARVDKLTNISRELENLQDDLCPAECKRPACKLLSKKISCYSQSIKLHSSNLTIINSPNFYSSNSSISAFDVDELIHEISSRYSTENYIGPWQDGQLVTAHCEGERRLLTDRNILSLAIENIVEYSLLHSAKMSPIEIIKISTKDIFSVTILHYDDFDNYRTISNMLESCSFDTPTGHVTQEIWPELFIAASAANILGANMSIIPSRRDRDISLQITIPL